MVRWCITIPPEGAARAVALNLHREFCSCLGDESVKIFDTATYLQAFGSLLKKPGNDMVVDLLNQSLIVQCLDFGASHLLVPALSPVTLFSLNLLRRQRVATLHWFFEDHRRANYWRDILGGYDVFLAIQRGDVQRACEEAGVRFALLPAAASPASRTEEPPVQRSVDVAFVGLPSAYRVRVLEEVHRAGISLSVGGANWSRYRGPLQACIISGTWVDEAQNAGALRRARIGLNLSVDEPGADRADVHVSPRVFDIMAQGCALVTEDVPLAREMLSGYHYLACTDAAGMVGALRRILAAYGDELPRIAANRARVLANDTYRQRADRIIALSGGTAANRPR